MGAGLWSVNCGTMEFLFTLILSCVIALMITTLVVRTLLSPAKYEESQLISFIRHPDELFLLVQYLLGLRKVSSQKPPEGLNEHQAYCYEILNRVSRSFAFVIMELPPVLRESICVFYLVLRGLDSVEDDMNIDVQEKAKMLASFSLLFPVHGKKDLASMQARESLMEMITTNNFGENENERELLRKFHHVTQTFAGLPVELRQCITDICKCMGDGMAEYLNKEVNSIAEYEQYCFYVAGLVGVGLSDIFVAAGFEDEAITKDNLSTDMGLFLQKTNISRDYLEDIEQDPPRIFYPREIWSQYVNDIHDMKLGQHQRAGVKCVNHMVCDALKHVQACLKYLSLLKQREVFRFCAIPQAMAIATLARCYNNPLVLKKVVKIRKGEALKMMGMESLEDAIEFFQKYCEEIQYKAQSASDMKMLQQVDSAFDTIQSFRAAVLA